MSDECFVNRNVPMSRLRILPKLFQQKILLLRGSLWLNMCISLNEECSYLEFFGPYFPVFGLNTERSECGKMRTWKNIDLFHAMSANSFETNNIWMLPFNANGLVVSCSASYIYVVTAYSVYFGRFQVRKFKAWITVMC